MTLVALSPLRRWILAGGVLVATAIGLVVCNIGESGRARAEIATAAATRRSEITALVAARLQALELRGQNAGSNPRLVAALSGNVDRATLRDLFENEWWWQSFREGFSATYLANPGQPPVFITGAAEVPLSVDDLVSRVRDSRWVGSALINANGWAHMVVASPVIMPGGPAPVLLLTQPFDAGKLSAIVESTGEAVLLSDGRQALAGAGKAAETAKLKAYIGREAELSRGAGRTRGQATIVSAAIAPGLHLISHLSTAALVSRATAGLAAVRVAIGLVGGGLFLALVASLLMKRRSVGVASPEAAEVFPPAISATVTEASSGSRYTLLQRIGGGGMAEVHLAVSVGERGFRRPCVIKRLRPELSENPAAVAQFTDEATLASSLVHANIVPIFDFARVGSQYFLVEEYIVGRDLGRLSRRARSVGKALSPDLVAYAAVETLKALDYAHAKRDHDGLPLGIVHRDISPENLMVTVRGEVQLLDFGVMKVDETRKRRTDFGELKGNLSYISPEQARGLQVDGRADLFSLGMVIYFCLTGESLYGADAGYDLLVKAAAGPGPEDLAKLQRLPAPFAKILTHALSPRPEDRFPTAFAFAEAFGRCAVDAPTRLGTLVAQLFGDELADEQNNLSLGVSGKSQSGPMAKVLPGPGATSEQPVPLPLRGR